MQRRKFIGKSIVASTFLLSSPNLVSAVSSENISLFDGKTLAGWHTTPRIYVPSRDRSFDDIPPEKLKQAVVDYYLQKDDPEERAKASDHGVWKVEDGAIVGGQTPDSKRGAYLLTDDKFDDFELTLEARPDWPADTGIIVRGHEIGSVGFQVLLDHRPGGAIGGVFGNGIGSFRAYPFVLDGEEQSGFQVDNLREMTTTKDFFRPDYSASADEFLAAWKSNDWNTFKIRCTGKLPLIEVWINSTLISKLDTGNLADRVPGYDPEAILSRLGRKGHIGFEVHDTDQMGRDRWASGAECRWRNISIIEL